MSTTDATALFAWLDRELWLVTAQAGEQSGGLIATFVSPASIVPEHPRITVGIAKHHHTWDLIEMSDAFGLHLLGIQNLSWVEHFGLQSGAEVDKLKGWTTFTAQTGSPLLGKTVGWFDCRVEARLDSGDRTVYLAEVVDSQITAYGQPLTMKTLIENAPSGMHSKLRQQLHRDSVLDADAIQAWKERQQQETLQ